ncbi:glucuronidase 2 [Actinidia rufa]|uniref:Glucuronidase 2 n=1 Tax=Actinidia rufa TaxID=165716 RepID=A0A7J0E846_9ERIC|nr:glucuronidase 2 [Actinidia rufa]
MTGMCHVGLVNPSSAIFLYSILCNSLLNTVKTAEFDPLRIRIGGSLQDQVVYKVGDWVKKCPHFKKREGGLFGFSHGCLPMNRWDELNNLFNQTGAVVTFGLNALYGRSKSKEDDSLWVGDWDPQNARDLMNYTVSRGYKIDSYELGNELCGSGVSARLDAVQYGKDLIALKELVKELYPNITTRPKVLGPAGFYDEKWFNDFLQATGPGVVDGLTHHIYNLGAGVDSTLINKVQDPYFLDQIAQTYKDISNTIRSFGPWTGAWIGEAGGAYNSGGKDVSHTFANGFCALLWHRLMGKIVLRTTHDSSPYLRIYSHCSKTKSGISLLLINMSNSTTFTVSVVDDLNFYPEERKSVDAYNQQQREEYHLTPKDGNIQSDVLLLNGTPLVLTESRDIPAMNPELVDASKPITIAPDSIVFATLNGFNAPACA